MRPLFELNVKGAKFEKKFLFKSVNIFREQNFRESFSK